MSDQACYWRADLDCWMANVPTTLSARAVDGIRDYLLPVQIDRRRGLGPGDVRDDLDRAIAALVAHRAGDRDKIMQNVISERVFTSHERVGPFRSFPRALVTFRERKDGPIVGQVVTGGSDDPVLMEN